MKNLITELNNPFGVKVCLVYTQKALKKLLGAHSQELPTDPKKCRGFVQDYWQEKNKQYIIVMYVNVEDFGLSHVKATTVHEIVHVYQYLIRWIEEKKPSWEFEAYLIEDLVKQAWAAYERGKK